VRERLAKGLFNTLTYAKTEEANPARAAALLEALQTLAAAYPDDAAVARLVAAARDHGLDEPTCGVRRVRAGP
jgi:hypothetical protein